MIPLSAPWSPLPAPPAPKLSTITTCNRAIEINGSAAPGTKLWAGDAGDGEASDRGAAPQPGL